MSNIILINKIRYAVHCPLYRNQYFISVRKMDSKIISFWKSINLLITKPHVVNKRIWGCNFLIKCICQFDNANHEYAFDDLVLNNPNEINSFINLLLYNTKWRRIDENQVTEEQKNIIEVILVHLLPKTFTESHCYQLVCLRKDALTATFYDVTPKHLNQKLCPNFAYTFQLRDDDIDISGNYDINSHFYTWLSKEILPQIVKWHKQYLDDNTNKSMPVKDSLKLVSHTKYYNKYNELKIKYGKEMVKIWPECTDPTKFVYEDVAIATYLLLLWEETHLEDEVKTVNFVDIGCGNGLLVYILINEGHKGLGVDVRKRKIWDMYGENINLKENTVRPENIQMFAAFDWVIGNHSDELTPWIPVIASQSSYKCNFFLLPCCAYNFDGTKYQRKNSSKSQYNEYLDHIYKLCEDCGFNTEVDRLKIPSTKRICLVGRTRKYLENDHSNNTQNILFIINDGKKVNNIENNTCKIDAFKARSAIEKVRNCTQIEKSIIDSIVTSISSFLLEDCNFKNEWNPGKEVYIEELIKIIPQETLKILKTECGGVQTLLKNNHIFNVKKGKVQLKHPKSIEETMNALKKHRNKNTTLKLQVKPCWFYINHPQGCPLTDTNCSFIHSNN